MRKYEQGGRKMVAEHLYTHIFVALGIKVWTMLGLSLLINPILV
jgi:hypothetical protein